MPDLDARLGAARAELLKEIKAPELADIRGRARTLRRRRRGVAAFGAAVAMLVTVGTVASVLGDGGGGRGRGDVAATESPWTQPTYAGGGLTVLGLFRPVLDLPGTLRDVEFVDARTGYALAVGCPDAGQPCELALATTKDGGETWTRRPVPVESKVQLPSLIPLGDGVLLLVGGDPSVFSPDDGQTWQSADQVPLPPSADSIPENGRLWLAGDGAAAGCVVRQIDVWSALSRATRLARLANQPEMDVCWVAPAPAADGTWWAGGISRGGARTPVVAMTHDGRKWIPKTLPAAGTAEAWAQVSTLGSETFATVVSPLGDTGVLRVHGIYRYDAASGAFRQYGDTQGLGTLVGDLVPLLDGRLVAADADLGWRVSGPDGTGFHEAGGNMPWVSRVQRTGFGWVAYDLFRGGWAAWSGDGETWRKIHVN